jgi:glycosyltransferase involved in cell wall biosynthesis
MINKLKIAVYSGDIPSTTFIERLIQGLANTGNSIYLFGFIKEKTDYNSSVSVFAYKNTKRHKALHFITYSLLLFCFKPKEKQKLDAILHAQSKNVLLAKVKCYPVLWHKPDIFHLQWAKGLADWIWVKEFGVKLVLSLRGAHINYSPIADASLAAMYRENFPKVDAFHAVSKAIGLEAETYGAAKEKIKVVYSGLPLNLEAFTTSKQNTIFQMVSIGRAHWIKGYTYALDACKLLKDHNIKFNYTIVGGANDIEYAYQVHDLKLTNEVKLLDKLPYTEVQEIMKKANLLLLPSVEEGIANVVLEAMSLETLVLTTDCGGMAEVIEDGVNGFAVPIRDAQAMATKIIQIAALPQVKKTEILKNAILTIKKQHSTHHMVDQMLALYQSL